MMRSLVVGLSLLVMGFPANATGTSLSAELNKLEAHGSACRAYLLLINDSGASFESLKFDLVMFDADGVITKRLAVQAAPMPVGKTSVKAFDVTEQPCAEISRILLNDVLECRDTNGSRTDCLAIVKTSTRGSVEFIK